MHEREACCTFKRGTHCTFHPYCHACISDASETLVTAPPVKCRLFRTLNHDYANYYVVPSPLVAGFGSSGRVKHRAQFHAHIHIYTIHIYIYICTHPMDLPFLLFEGYFGDGM